MSSIQENDQPLPVTMKELYDYMAQVRKHFDLSFHEMDQIRMGIHVSANKAELVFTYGNQALSINIIK